MLPPSSGWSEDGGIMVLQNVGIMPHNYTVITQKTMISCHLFLTRSLSLSDSYSSWLQLACNIPFSLDRVKEGVNTRLRAESAPLPEYLFSRSVAGATHVDIIRGLELASEGSLYGRFFCMYPDRVISLTHWLAYWMKKGKFAPKGWLMYAPLIFIVPHSFHLLSHSTYFSNLLILLITG